MQLYCSIQNHLYLNKEGYDARQGLDDIYDSSFVSLCGSRNNRFGVDSRAGDTNIADGRAGRGPSFSRN